MYVSNFERELSNKVNESLLYSAATKSMLRKWFVKMHKAGAESQQPEIDELKAQLEAGRKERKHCSDCVLYETGYPGYCYEKDDESDNIPCDNYTPRERS